MMYTTMAITVHDHVHLAGAGPSVIGVGAIDAAVGKGPEPGSFAAMVQCSLDLIEFGAKHGGFLFCRDFLVGFDFGPVFLVLPIGVQKYLLANLKNGSESRQSRWPDRK
jgi:hypothetical protein